MNHRLKKIIIIILGTLISINSSCKADTTKNTNISIDTNTHKQINQNDQIYKTKEWKNISSFWQKMNTVDYKQNTSKLISIYKKIEGEYKSMNADLIQLKQKNYITEKEYKSLQKEINRKYEDLQMNNPVITCYDAAAVDMKQYMLQSDLEKRYKIIEKLFDEGKVNTKTFETTKNQIEKELKELYKLENPKAKDTIDPKTADLIINLNR